MDQIGCHDGLNSSPGASYRSSLTLVLRAATWTLPLRLAKALLVPEPIHLIWPHTAHWEGGWWHRLLFMGELRRVRNGWGMGLHTLSPYLTTRWCCSGLKSRLVLTGKPRFSLILVQNKSVQFKFYSSVEFNKNTLNFTGIQFFWKIRIGKHENKEKPSYLFYRICVSECFAVGSLYTSVSI